MLETLSTVSQILELELHLHDPDYMTYGDGPWAFRGTSKQHGNLLPTLSRFLAGHVSEANAIHIEAEQMKHFRMHYSNVWNAVLGTPAPSEIEDQLRCLSTMQHYDVPTRLLDWSTNIWVGIYFACAGTDSDGEDGELWIYDRKGFVDSARHDNHATLFYPPRAIAPYLVELDFGLTGRMTAQGGLHTVCNYPLMDQQTIFESGVLRRISIAKEVKKSALEYADRYRNISAKTLFPDIVGVGSYARWHLKSLRTLLT